MDVAQNMTDILLVSLVTELWVRLWWFSYLQISFEPPMSTLQGIDHAPKVKKFSIKHGGILSPEKMLPISWFEQHKSLVWWKTNYKHLGHHQVNQKAIPVSTDRCLSGELRLCSYPFHLLMHSNHNVFIGKMMMECNTSLFWDYCDNAVIDRSSLKSWITCQCLFMRRWEYLDYLRY